jgi:hypothetical protein
MITQLGPSPFYPVPSLAGLLSQEEDLAAADPTGSAPASAPAAAAPAAPPPPGASAFPTVLEEFAYRYQLDLGFQFSLSSVQAEAPAEPTRAAPAETARPSVSEDRVEPGSRRAVVLSAFRDLRQTQVRSFLQHNQQVASRHPEPTAGQVRRAGQSVARAFRVDFSLDVSFLQQFARQSQSLSEYGERAFGTYLDVSATLSLESPEQAQAFFDRVDQLLAGAEEGLKGAIPAFLQDMAQQLGLGDREVEALGGLLGDRVDAFFARAAEVLGRAEAQLAGAGAPLPVEATASAEPVAA